MKQKMLRAAIQSDADDDMAELGRLLHEALVVAKRLEGRGVQMGNLGCSAEQVKRLSEGTEGDAYTLRKGVGGEVSAMAQPAKTYVVRFLRVTWLGNVREESEDVEATSKAQAKRCIADHARLIHMDRGWHGGYVIDRTSSMTAEEITS